MLARLNNTIFLPDISSKYQNISSDRSQYSTTQVLKGVGKDRSSSEMTGNSEREESMQDGLIDKGPEVEKKGFNGICNVSTSASRSL